MSKMNCVYASLTRTSPNLVKFGSFLSGALAKVQQNIIGWMGQQSM